MQSHHEIKITIRSHETSSALKQEIRNNITIKMNEGWEFVNLSLNGPDICVQFKQHT